MDPLSEQVERVLRDLQPLLKVDGGGAEFDRIEGTPRTSA